MNRNDHAMVYIVNEMTLRYTSLLRVQWKEASLKKWGLF